jgi:hypothetical protein
LTAPGRSEQHLLGREKGSLQKAAGHFGAKGAKMATFSTVTDTYTIDIENSITAHATKQAACQTRIVATAGRILPGG